MSGYSAYGRVMALKPAISVVMGAPSTTVLVVDLLRAVPGSIIIL